MPTLIPPMLLFISNHKITPLTPSISYSWSLLSKIKIFLTIRKKIIAKKKKVIHFSQFQIISAVPWAMKETKDMHIWSMQQQYLNRMKVQTHTWLVDWWIFSEKPFSFRTAAIRWPTALKKKLINIVSS